MNKEKCKICKKNSGDDGFRYQKYMSKTKKIVEEGYYCKKHGEKMIKKLNLVEKLVCPFGNH